jgi:NAD-dependent SIR2 family protein deacetylase
MKRWFLIAIFATHLCLADELKGNFFSNPDMISYHEIIEQLDSKSLDMCWQFGKNDFFHFISKKNEVYFEILLEKMPRSYEAVKELFVEEELESDGEKKKYYIFSYEWKIDIEPISNQLQIQDKPRSSNTSSYLVDQRRIFKQVAPQSMAVNDLVSVICHDHILFYTGAGLSIASGVPSMDQLNGLLGLKEGEEFVSSLQNALQNPGKMVEKILQFHHACIYSPPTEAHRAIKQLALFKNTKIVTENLDCLHEYSGILPYRINAEQLREEIGSSQLRDIDYIVCIGLSADDRGFLGWYKHHHPTGRIISIDLGHPSYLGDEDFIIRADLQTLIPFIEKSIVNRESEAVVYE